MIRDTPKSPSHPPSARSSSSRASSTTSCLSSTSTPAARTSSSSTTARTPVPRPLVVCTTIRTPLTTVLFGPLTEILGLQVRMNVQRKCVEARTSKATKDIGVLQKGADFIKAFALGFDVNDAIALLRLDNLYLDSFEIKDSNALMFRTVSPRLAGKDGKTKFTIENTKKIHIMGSFQNIKVARDAIVSLIGSRSGKVYAGLRMVSSRMRQRAL
ncbi:hypothetical protein B0H14DRAFT_3098588 [Mycena olivaceomarginata]|nr:hypothetical protein B0H14DRAFT_3098588 [Mycena olivaceomarginata]